MYAVTTPTHHVTYLTSAVTTPTRHATYYACHVTYSACHVTTQGLYEMPPIKRMYIRQTLEACSSFCDGHDLFAVVYGCASSLTSMSSH